MGLISDIFGYIGAGRAGHKIDVGYHDAIQGLLGTAGGQTSGLQDAAGNAIGAVNTATGAGNQILGNTLGQIGGTLDPYLQGGQTGVNTIQDFLGKGGVQPFQFNQQDWMNDPGLKFQLAQGTEAINNSASAKGLLQSGNVLRDLTKYGQGLGNIYYTDAFNRAMEAYNTNRLSQVTNLGAASDLMTGGLGAAKTMAGAQLGVGGQQSENVIGAGKYTGNTLTNIQKFLADLNMGAAEKAGDWATQKGLAAAKTSAGRTRGAGAIAEDVASLIAGLLGGGAGGGAGGIDLGYLFKSPGLGNIG